MNSPIILTGCPRSGTSLISQALAKSGCFSGVISKRNMFENTNIRETIVKPYFAALNADFAGQYPLPKYTFTPIGWKERVNASIKAQGYKDGVWMVKDTKASLIWKVWHGAYPNAKWIIVRRRTGDIIQSCLKTGYMKAFQSKELQQQIGVNTEEEGWLWWVREYEKQFVQMVEAGLDIKVVYPERMVMGNYTQLYETIEWTGLTAPNDILNYIHPLLWKSRQRQGGK